MINDGLWNVIDVGSVIPFVLLPAIPFSPPPIELPGIICVFLGTPSSCVSNSNITVPPFEVDLPPFPPSPLSPRAPTKIYEKKKCEF